VAEVPGGMQTDDESACPSHVFVCGLPPLLIRKVEPLRPSSRGYLFLCNYTEKAVRTDEHRRGPLPDHEDIVHQVFVEWREQVGPEEQHLANLLDRESVERQVLRRTVPRVISRARYENNKHADRVGATDLPAQASAPAQDWTDLRIDLEQGVGNLAPHERQILELRRQGKTFDEIGAEVGMAKQRASEICSAVVARLQKIYSRV
jgi:DNA-directed RNA polymerase specialized sigma subunit